MRVILWARQLFLYIKAADLFIPVYTWYKVDLPVVYHEVSGIIRYEYYITVPVPHHSTEATKQTYTVQGSAAEVWEATVQG